MRPEKPAEEEENSEKPLADQQHVLLHQPVPEAEDGEQAGLELHRHGKRGGQPVRSAGLHVQLLRQVRGGDQAAGNRTPAPEERFCVAEGQEQEGAGEHEAQEEVGRE